jgi:hypothetical protein
VAFGIRGAAVAMSKISSMLRPPVAGEALKIIGDDRKVAGI